MEVAISALRAELSTWISRARDGEEIVVTERGTPVARLLPIGTASLIDQLVADGVLGNPRSTDRPVARGAKRVEPHGSVADLVTDLRR